MTNARRCSSTSFNQWRCLGRQKEKAAILMAIVLLLVMVVGVQEDLNAR